MSDDNANANTNTVHRFKLVLLGDSGVGKTSLAVRFVRDVFRTYDPTTGGTFLTQKVEVEVDSSETDDSNASTVVVEVTKFHIWDTAGGDRFRSVAPLYYKGAAAAIVVYDVTDLESFRSAKSWMEELRELSEPIVIALAGNKVDLFGIGFDSDSNPRTVAFEEADAYALEHGILHFGTSAKTARNVQELFEEIARTLPRPVPKPAPRPAPATRSTSLVSPTIMDTPELQLQLQLQSPLLTPEEEEGSSLSDAITTSREDGGDHDRSRTTIVSRVVPWLAAWCCFKGKPLGSSAVLSYLFENYFTEHD